MKTQEQKLRLAPPAGFEPATFSLEGRRLIIADQSMLRLFVAQNGSFGAES
jgi:hypothetical protein